MRLFLATLLLIGPLAAEAQETRRPYRIGVLNEAFAATHPTVEGLKAGLREAGLAEGRDVTFDIRFTEGDAQATRAAAAALVKAGVDLIVTSQDGPTQAAKDATKTVPIVFTLVGDPVAAGLVRNLAEPEANVTGVSSLQTELTAKRLEVLKTLVPGLRRVWLIHYGGDLTASKMLARARDAAPRVKVDLVPRAVLNAQELAQALGELRPGDALLAPEIATLDIPVAILNASLKSRIPAVFTTALWVGHGGLVSYGPDYYAQGVQAAGLVAKILRGARPSDVPVEGADRIELAVNLKTAELLGVTVPRKIMLRAEIFPAMSSPTPSAAPRGRLVRKYVVVLLVLVGGVLMASSLVELYFAYQETKRAIVREERAKATAAAAQIERFVKEVERQVRETTRAASDDPAAAQLGQGKLAFRGGLGAALADQRELDFFRLLRDVPAISELGHLDVSGKEQLRVSRLALDAVGSQEDFSQAPKFLGAKTGKTYWSPVHLRNGVEPYLTLAVPVGQYAVEVTTAEISLKAVQQAIAQVHVGPGGYAYVVDSQGRLFAHPDIRLVRQNRDLSALPQVRDAQAERSARPGGPGGADDAGTVAEGLQGGQILAAHAGIAPLGWLVLVERPLADAYAPLRAPILRSAIVFALGLLLSVLASLVLARRMVAPIRLLQAGAARIGAGDLGHRIEVRTGDELEALGEEFNRTAAQLEESYANLEQKVEARTRDLSEALEQQTATSEILGVISSSPTDVQPVFDAIARNAARLCDAQFCHVFRSDGQLLHLAAHHGVTTEGIEALRRVWPIPPSPGTAVGRAVLSRGVTHIADVHADPAYEHKAVAQVATFRSVVAVPMMREGVPIGAIAVARPQVGFFPDRQTELLKTFADQAVIAIENVRLFTELEAKNRDLTETLEQQTATSEILRVISSSPTDVQPVFDSIVASAVRLCDASFGGLLRFDGELLHVAAAHNVEPEGLAFFHRLFPIRPTPDIAIGRAILERTVIHFEDVLREPHNPVREAARAALGYRAWLAVPMLRDETGIGVISCWRPEPRAFSDKQIELLKTFADQAVIAIENVRLFTELQEKNQALTKAHAQVTEALEQQTATGEILRVISSSPPTSSRCSTRSPPTHSD